MSVDEVVLTVFALVLGPGLWVMWLWRASRIPMVRGGRPAVTSIALALIAAVVLIFSVLKTAASFDVVDAPKYQLMYLALGLAWIRLAYTLFPYLGLSPRDDVVERGNGTAAISLAGAIVGVALCYSGGNIGDGPGWGVVVFSGALATGALILTWALLAQLTSIVDAVTVDRDRAAGIRLAVFLVSCGLVLGRGVAGDWISMHSTVVDLGSVLPAIAIILVLAVIVESLAKPTAERPRAPMFAFGVLPAMVYLLIAAVAVLRVGWPA